MNAEGDREQESHDPSDQRESSSPLPKVKRLVDDSNAFGLQVHRSKDCGAHDADGADDGLCEEEPNRPGEHRGGECRQTWHTARFVA